MSIEDQNYLDKAKRRATNVRKFDSEQEEDIGVPDFSNSEKKPKRIWGDLEDDVLDVKAKRGDKKRRIQDETDSQTALDELNGYLAGDKETLGKSDSDLPEVDWSKSIKVVDSVSKQHKEKPANNPFANLRDLMSSENISNDEGIVSEPESNKKDKPISGSNEIIKKITREKTEVVVPESEGVKEDMEVSKEKGEKLLAGITEMMVRDWIKESNNGQPLVKPLLEKDIVRLKEYAESKGEKWDGRITYMEPSAKEFWYGTKNYPGFSLSSRAKKILVEKYPEYADIKNELEVADPQEYFIDDSELITEKNDSPEVKAEVETEKVVSEAVMSEKVEPADKEIVEEDTESEELKSQEDTSRVTVDTTRPTAAYKRVENKEKTPEQNEYLSIKREFKEAQQNFLFVLENDYKGNYDPILSKEFAAKSFNKRFGLGREKMSDEVLDEYDKFVLARKAFKDYSKNSEVFNSIAGRAERIYKAKHPDSEDFSIKASIANRYVVSPAKKRLEVQTAKLMPEAVSKNYKKILELIKKHPKTALAVGAVAVGVGGFVAGAATTTAYASRAVVGMTAKYFVSKVGEETIINEKKINAEELRREMVDQIDNDDFDLEEMEEEYFTNENSLQRRTTGVKTASWIAGGAFAAGYSADVASIASGVTDGVPDVSPSVSADNFSDVSPYESYLKPESDIGLPQYDIDQPVDGISDITEELRPEESILEDKLNETNIESDASVANANLSEFVKSLDIKPEQAVDLELSPDVSPEVSSSVVESVNVSTVEIELFHEVKSTENLSTILFEGIKQRIEAGEIKLPPGVTSDGLAHHMYQSFPEMTSAKDISPTLTRDQWIELGVKSGNPHNIRPGEVIDVQALVEKMWGATPEIDVDIPVVEKPVDLNVDIDVKNIDFDSINRDSAAGEVDIDLDRVNPEVSYPGDLGIETSEVVDVEEVLPVDGAGTIDEVSPDTATTDSVGEGGFSTTDSDGGAENLETSNASEGHIDGSELGFDDPRHSINNSFEISDRLKEEVLSFSEEKISAGEMLNPEGNPNFLFDHLTKLFENEIHGPEDGREITLPLRFVSPTQTGSGWFKFVDDIPGLLKYQLPELKPGFSFDQSALTPKDYRDIGISSGNPLDIIKTDKIQIGKLYEYILSGDIEAFRESVKNSK